MYKKGMKPLVTAMAILALVLASCATKPEAPKEVLPEPTTTTTVQAPIPEVVPVTTTTVAVPVTTTIALPSVSEVELRNLFGQANSLKIEAGQNELDRVVPESFKAADDEFASILTGYNAAMDEVAFDGVKAYPLKERLEKSIAAWESVIAEGMPLRAQEESDKAVDLKFAAMSAEAPDLAAERWEGSETLLSDANAIFETKDYAMAIAAYKQAGAGFEVAAEKAKANKAREKIFTEGYAKYADSNFKMGEQKVAEEEELWASGSYEDLKAGAAALKDANGYYDFVISTGSQYKSFEAKDRAQAAQDKALSIKADVNAPEQYSDACDILAEAAKNQSEGSYESSTIWFGDAAEAFDAAYDASMTLQTASEDAIAAAEAAVQASQDKSDMAGVDGNVYLPEAASYLEKAKSLNEDKLFSDATTNANEAVNYATMSDEFVDKETARIAAAEQAKLAADKAAADPSMANARKRMAWAEDNKISADYPAEYKSAHDSMAAAERAYTNEAYAPAKTLADDASTTLSDSFQKQVMADRAEKAAAAKAAAEAKAAEAKAAEAKAAEVKAEEVKVAEEKAAEDNAAKAAAEAKAKADAEAKAAEEARAAALAQAKAAAQADIDAAQGKYDWAVSKNAANNYPEQLGKGASEIADAKSAFGANDYAAASAKAKAAVDTLAGIEEFAPLPAVYIVRLIPERRDCLWRIAEYPFIYNNPLKWPVLYEANKKTFKDPSNPNLIYPNQVLKVPSIKGEKRSGTWDPKKTYNPLPKK